MACLRFLQQCWASTLSKGGHDHNVLSSLKILSAKPGHLRASLTVEQRHVNNHKNVHGGVILGLTDTLTSLTLSTLGMTPTGVSVNISTEFVRPGGQVGAEIIGVGEVVKLGKTLAFTKVTLYTPDNKVIAFGSHTKFLGEAKPTISFSPDGEKEIPLERAKL